MEPLISIKLMEPSRVYQPGDRLTCQYQVDAVVPHEVVALEASVLWYTEGKGDEDLSVHFFERRVPADVEGGDLRQLWQFTTQLPNSPLSYDGVIVKVRWAVRVRLFLRRGKEVFYEHPFVLGQVPRATEVAAPCDAPRAAKSPADEDDPHEPPPAVPSNGRRRK